MIFLIVEALGILMMVNIIQTHDSQTQTNEVSKAFSLLTVILSFQH